MGCGQSTSSSPTQANVKGNVERTETGPVEEVKVETESIGELNSNNANGTPLLKNIAKNGEETAPVKSPVSHISVPTNSQVDFFRMLDHKIETGPDYVSINEEKGS